MVFYINVFGCHGFCHLWKDNCVIATCLLAKVNWSTWSLIVNDVLSTNNSALSLILWFLYMFYNISSLVIIWHKIRNCHWNLFLHSPSYISHFLVTNTIMAHGIEFFQSYFISDLYLIYILNDFKKSNVCLFCYNSFLYKETVKHSIVCSYGLQWWCKSLYIK